MQYLLITYSDEGFADQITLQEISAAHMRLGAELQEAGALVGGNRLRRSASATTVRTVSGAQSLHDGPYAETREQLGGFYIIDVPDMQAAQHWAAQCPGAIWGHIEVRPFSTYPER